MCRAAKPIVWVVHADEVLAAGIRAVLGSADEFEVIPKWSEGDASPAGKHAHSANIIVADYRTGLRLMAGPKTNGSVLIVATSDGEMYVRRALQAGVRGFLLHECRSAELIEAVRTLSRGGTALSASVGARIAESMAYEELTPRESAVLRGLMRGSSNKAIARELAISIGTAKSHVKAILSKLKAASRTEAVAVAQRRGLSHHSDELPTRTRSAGPTARFSAGQNGSSREVRIY